MACAQGAPPGEAAEPPEGAPPEQPGEAPAGESGDAGPAQRSGRLWVPGQ
jgi:hypothetical protein